jgi:hypothetical protein
MDKHIITLEDTCKTFISTIVSSASIMNWKRLAIETHVSPSKVKIEYVVSTKKRGVVKRTEDIDVAIQNYNYYD